MKFGTILLNNKLYDLDSLEKKELQDLYLSNYNNKKCEYEKAKKICDRKENENLEYEQTIPIIFKNFLDSSSIYAKGEAVIQRAIVQKTSNEAILEKIKNKKNSMDTNIKSINPNFGKTNYKYHIIQNDVEKSIDKYQKVLEELADYFDSKIEQMIIRKVELEANMIGSIITSEYYLEEEIRRKEEKENDKLLLSLSSSVKNMVKKLTKKKEEKNIDVTLLDVYQDKAELEEEQKIILNNLVEKTQNSKKDNITKIEELDNEIQDLEKEIKKANRNKEKVLLEAMESENKELTILKNSKNIVGKIKFFLKSKLNPTSVIYETIINPFNDYILAYEENVLDNIKK